MLDGSSSHNFSGRFGRPLVGLRTTRPVSGDEGDRSVDQVAESVRELVRAGGDQLLAEVRVAVAWHIAEEPPAERVRAVALDDGKGVDRRAERLRELLPVDGEVVVNEDPRRQGRPAESRIAGQ